MKRRIVLLGPPASGKGTQADMITARYGIASASPGAMLREEKRAGSELGLQADSLTSQGKLVPDDTINQLVGNWLASGHTDFVFDGYPRSIGQAQALEGMLDARQIPLDVVLSFEADFETLRRRVLNRLVCSGCARNFSLGLSVASESVPCPVCGGALVRRTDDTDETLARRMEEYSAKTAPVGDFYASRGLLRPVDSTRAPEAVFSEIASILEGA